MCNYNTSINNWCVCNWKSKNNDADGQPSRTDSYTLLRRLFFSRGNKQIKGPLSLSLHHISELKSQNIFGSWPDLCIGISWFRYFLCLFSFLVWRIWADKRWVFVHKSALVLDLLIHCLFRFVFKCLIYVDFVLLCLTARYFVEQCFISPLFLLQSVCFCYFFLICSCFVFTVSSDLRFLVVEFCLRFDCSVWEHFCVKINKLCFHGEFGFLNLIRVYFVSFEWSLAGFFSSFYWGNAVFMLPIGDRKFLHFTFYYLQD